jgi:hypothetical protein
MKIERPLRLIGIALVGLAMLTLPLPAFSQNCALCYTQAASAGARMIQALRSGILVLIVPPMFMWVAITVIVYRKRNQFRQVDYTPESDRNWQQDR